MPAGISTQVAIDLSAQTKSIAMYDEPQDEKWIENRALEIHLMEQVPLPIARSEAMAEWERLKKHPSSRTIMTGSPEENPD